VIFRETAIAGAFEVEPEVIEDERGYFARTFAVDEFASHGLVTAVVQCNLSYNTHRGTLRGVHFQAPPCGECKLVRCTRGAIYDVLVDLRPDSPTQCEWVAIELTSENRRMVYIPEGLAHGFQTLEDGSEIFYQMSQAYIPTHARGVRWNDPAFGIEWPLVDQRVISQKDQSYADFDP
jgi:dTDP-4-dehydrorhamnose 3,5-epimerase